MMGPIDVATFGRMTVCMDPAGAAFGFWQPGEHKGAQIENEPGSMCWTEVMTRGGDKARPFYEKVLGAVTEKMPEMEYHTFHKNEGDKAFAGLLSMDETFPPQIPSHWMPYFAVADANAGAEKVKELGGTVHQGPFDTPYGRIAIVADPFGASFTLIKLTEKALT